MLTPLSCLFISYYFCTTLFSLYIIIIYWNLFSRRRSHVVLLLYQWIGNRLWTHQAVFHLSLRPFVIVTSRGTETGELNHHSSHHQASYQDAASPHLWYLASLHASDDFWHLIVSHGLVAIISAIVTYIRNTLSLLVVCYRTLELYPTSTIVQLFHQ